jgi:hypothetical protein
MLGLSSPLDALASVAGDVTCALLLAPRAAVASPGARHATARRCLAIGTARPAHASAFIPLPHSFSELYNAFTRRKCHVCGSVPLQPACCLLCGALVCAGGACCREGGDDEAVRHAAVCGHGVGAFIVVRLTTTLLVMGRR